MTEPRQLSTRDAQRLLAVEQLEGWRHFAQTQTEFMERLAGQAINHVLEVFTATFPVGGQISRDYAVAAGAVEVNNLAAAANIVTVSSGSPGELAPTGGVGVYLVAGGTSRTVAIASRQFTLYGTEGDEVSVQVFTAGLRPAAGG